MWKPTSEESIQLAIDERTLLESSWLDVKAATGDSDGARRETAKDLASFALDGGALLIGIAEDKATRSFSLSPIELHDAVEKLEQIAANRVDPPLHIRVVEIPSQANSDEGYLYVEIPPSPQAPHMVGGIYYARGERTTRRLSDAEVVRLHMQRQVRDQAADRALRELIARDPVPLESRQTGHLYLVGEPLSGSGEMAREVTRSLNNHLMFDLRQVAERALPKDLREIAPSIGYAQQLVRRARGAAFSSLENGSRALRDLQQDRTMVDVEVEESGAIRMTFGRATDLSGRGESEVIFDVLAVANALRLVHWARVLSEKTDYRGAWAFGLAATNLHGLKSYQAFAEWGFDLDYDFYDRESYEATTAAHVSELENSPGAVADRLVGGLLRGLGTESKYSEHLGGRSA